MVFMLIKYLSINTIGRVLPVGIHRTKWITLTVGFAISSNAGTSIHYVQARAYGGSHTLVRVGANLSYLRIASLADLLNAMLNICIRRMC